MDSNTVNYWISGLADWSLGHAPEILAFLAVFLPIVLWKSEGDDSARRPEAGWDRLPGLFKLFWKPMYLMENAVGGVFVSAFERRTRRYSEFIGASGLPLTPGRVYVCQFLSAPVFGLLGTVAFAMSFVTPFFATLFVLFMVFAGWQMPAITLQNCAERRQEEITKSLPFAIDLIGSAMRAGLEFGAAMRYYTNLGGGGALEEEFLRVIQDVTLGKPFTESLQAMADRLHIKSFTAFVGVVSYGAEIGASIAATLKLHGAELRRERFALAEQKAARAPSLMIFPLAVFIMPAVFIIIFVPVIMQYQATKTM